MSDMESIVMKLIAARLKFYELVPECYWEDTIKDLTECIEYVKGTSRVIRCKQCRYYQENNDCMLYDGLMETKEDDYCSRAELLTEENRLWSVSEEGD